MTAFLGFYSIPDDEEYTLIKEYLIRKIKACAYITPRFYIDSTMLNVHT